MSDRIAQTIGLHYPQERLADLRRGVAAAARDLGFDDALACAEWLQSATLTETHLQVLAAHLTIGETYFFRDKNTFHTLATHVLPELIRARRGGVQRLRLWSAACSSGEEAYSLAILLHQVLPDLADWHVTILATDLNPLFLRKAVAGVYGEWSFRDAPGGLKERYFTRTADGRYAVRPAIRQLVTVESLNLVEDGYPSLATDTNAMDLICCRNVLMYFTPSQTRHVVRKLHHALVDGGWLAVSAVEASHELFPQFATRTFPGVILYQRHDADPAPSRPWTPAPDEQWRPATSALACLPATSSTPPPAPAAPAVAATEAYAAGLTLYEAGRYGEAVDTLLASFTARPTESKTFSLLARALANQGRLAEAIVWCDRWLSADKMDAAGHYLRAMVLMEHGQPDEAKRSLQRALYLDPQCALAHFALGNLARGRGRTASTDADRHFANALQLLKRLPPDDPLPESDGLTAGRLMDTITAMTAAGPI